MTPIAKNIFVIDEQGNQYEATYPKRAQGLVKSGRARFVNETTICLACPPNNILEDNNMNENINKIDGTNKPLELTMDYVLNRIDYIMKDASHVHGAIEALRNMDINASGDGSDCARGEAISIAVQSRETTNQQLLKLLEKMYDDLKISSESEEQKKARTLSKMIENVKLPPDKMAETIQSIVQNIFSS